MKHILPHPWFAAAIFCTWVILAGTYSPLSYAFAALLAVVLSRMIRVLEPRYAHPKSLKAAMKLSVIVLYDIVRSNIAVARIILGRKSSKHVSGFVPIPLTMKNPNGLAVLGIIITSTPGTLWVQYDSRRNMLLLHVLDLVDKSEWVELIQNRYERLLMEIFE